LTNYQNYGTNTTTGNIANLPSGLTTYINLGSNTTTGDIANLPSGLTYYYNTGSNTTNTYTAGRIWKTPFEYFYLRSVTGLSTTAVDNILIDMASSITTSAGNKTIDLQGTNGARTSASNSAVTYLQGIGFTVLTN
jgi:hypothetical protein